MIKVWDPLQRLMHWGLALSVAIAWLTAEETGIWHEWVGYVALGLIGARLIWGIVGPRYARFSQFIRGPKTVIDYTRDMFKMREKRYIGHNPLGAVMVGALLLTTAATGVTGWLVAEPARLAMLPEIPAIVAPAFADSDEGGYEYGESEEELLGEVHEVLASLLLLLIAAHIGGVIYASKRHRENLAAAMITGKKPAPSEEDIA